MKVSLTSGRYPFGRLMPGVRRFFAPGDFELLARAGLPSLSDALILAPFFPIAAFVEAAFFRVSGARAVPATLGVLVGLAAFTAFPDLAEVEALTAVRALAEFAVLADFVALADFGALVVFVVLGEVRVLVELEILAELEALAEFRDLLMFAVLADLRAFAAAVGLAVLAVFGRLVDLADFAVLVAMADFVALVVFCGRDTALALPTILAPALRGPALADFVLLEWPLTAI